MSDLGNKKLMAQNIQYYLDFKRITRQDFCDALGFKYSTVSEWLQGRKYPRIDKIEMMANYFEVSKADLVERHLPYHTLKDFEANKGIAVPPQQSTDTTLPPGAFPINSSNSVLIPVLGSVAAGVPIYAENNIIGYEDIPREWTNGGKEYFALRVKGDSMEPKIFEGDTIIVKKQNYIDNGEIAVVLINGDEATVKQVKKTKEGLMLIGFNAAVYSPTLYTPEEVINLPVQVIGKVMELRRQL